MFSAIGWDSSFSLNPEFPLLFFCYFRIRPRLEFAALAVVERAVFPGRERGRNGIEKIDRGAARRVGKEGEAKVFSSSVSVHPSFHLLLSLSSSHPHLPILSLYLFPLFLAHALFSHFSPSFLPLPPPSFPCFSFPLFLLSLKPSPSPPLRSLSPYLAPRGSRFEKSLCYSDITSQSENASLSGLLAHSASQPSLFSLSLSLLSLSRDRR